MSDEKLAWDNQRIVDRIKADPQTFAFMSALAELSESASALLNNVILDSVSVDDVPGFQDALDKFDSAVEVAVSTRQAYLTWLENQ